LSRRLRRVCTTTLATLAALTALTGSAAAVHAHLTGAATNPPLTSAIPGTAAVPPVIDDLPPRRTPASPAGPASPSPTPAPPAPPTAPASTGGTTVTITATVTAPDRASRTRPGPIAAATQTSPADLVAALPRLPDGGTHGTWLLSDAHDAWGVADWHTNIVYISPRVPAHRLDDVVAHEWAHLHTARVYNGDINAMLTALNSRFGGQGLAGAEHAADCLARMLGATWTHYTDCTDPHALAAAALLLSGQRL
jgi:hypothetical protein